jgi:transcriptional regulator with XRE-family HTH domain
MPDPKKQPATQRQRRSTPLGDWVGRCRTERGWSRADFVTEAHARLPTDHPLYKRIKDNWIRHIEEGGRKNLNHLTIATLCIIFDATDREKRDLLIATGFNPLADDNGASTELQQAYLRLLSFLFSPTVAQIAVGGVMNGKITNWHDFFDVLCKSIELDQMSDKPDVNPLLTIATPSLPVHLDQQK